MSFGAFGICYLGYLPFMFFGVAYMLDLLCATKGSSSLFTLVALLTPASSLPPTFSIRSVFELLL